MLYNPKFTPAPFDGELTVKRRHKLITDAKGCALGTLSKKHVLDLNSEDVALFSRVEKRPTAKGKRKKCRIYTSPKGEMYLLDGVLFLEEEPVGRIPTREHRPSHIVMLLLATLMLAATLGFIWMIDIPFADVPSIEVEDQGGTWGGQGTIAVLDSTISPGSEGEYVFVLQNPHNVNLAYDFSIKELYNGTEVTDFPLEFRVRMNNVLLKSEEWLRAEELNFTEMILLPDSTHRFTLEWRWRFENGTDETDTYFGVDNGEYTLQFEMTAQVNEEG